MFTATDAKSPAEPGLSDQTQQRATASLSGVPQL